MSRLVLTSLKNKKTANGYLLVMPEQFLDSAEGPLRFMSTSNKIKKETIEEIHDFLFQLALSNKNNHRYWYSPVSELQPFISNVFKAIELRAFIRSTIKNSKELFYYKNANIFLLKFLKNALDKTTTINYGMKEDIKYIFYSFKYFILRYFNLFIWLGLNIFQTLRSRKPKEIPNHLDVLLFSRFENSCETMLGNSDRWYDNYLGELPHLLSKYKIAVIGRCGGNPRKISLGIEKFKKFPLITIFQLLRIRDVLGVFFETLFFKLATKFVIDKNLAQLAYVESLNHGSVIADGLLVEKALKIFLEQCKVKKIITMQENCSWENAIVVARNAVSPETQVLGYFHCPVMPSSFRYHIRKDVLSLKPHPDKILTLGPQMSKALRKLGDWHELLIDGYAFRGPGLQEISGQIKAPSSSILKVLVLLGGNFDNVNFLKWIESATKNFDSLKCQFLIKGHPRLPADEYLKKAAIKYGKNKIFDALRNDINWSEILSKVDCVLFKGTTAGFAGFCAGLPTIHFCHGGLLSDNVFFNTHDLCTTVYDERDLYHCLSAIKKQKHVNPVKSRKMREYALTYYDQTKESKNKIINYITAFKGVNNV
jgi:hypothetical protein